MFSVLVSAAKQSPSMYNPLAGMMSEGAEGSQVLMNGLI